MPNPKKFEDKKEWMGACLHQSKKEGREHKQSVAMCLNMWRTKDESKFTLSDLENYL